MGLPQSKLKMGSGKDPVQNFNTEGGEVMTIIGTDLGPTEIPPELFEAAYGSILTEDDPVTGRKAGQNEFLASNCRVVVPHAQAECLVVPGAGDSHTWRLFVDGSESTTPKSSFAPPEIESMSGRGAMDASTLGEELVYINGLNFGENDVDLQSVTYGETGSEYTACEMKGVAEAASGKPTCMFENSTCFLDGVSEKSHTLDITSQTIEEYSGVSVSQNEWTLLITKQAIPENEGANIAQGSDFGILKQIITEDDMMRIVISTAPSVTFVSTADVIIGSTTVPSVTVTKTTHSHTATGTLAKTLTGATTNVIISSAAGVTFVTTAKLKIGSTTVEGATFDKGIEQQSNINKIKPEDCLSYHLSAMKGSKAGCQLDSHRKITCFTVPGVGNGLLWKVTVRGQTNSKSEGARTSYAPPSIVSIFPFEYPTLKHADGDQEVQIVLVGKNLGIRILLQTENLN